jgi:hypothetical protein
MTDEDRPAEPFTDEEQLRTSPRTLDRSSAARFTDEEVAFLRHVRFGELPARVRPAELVEAVDAETPAEMPYRPFDPREFGGSGDL